MQCWRCSACRRRWTQTLETYQSVSVFKNKKPDVEFLWCRLSLEDLSCQCFWDAVMDVLHIDRSLAVLTLWHSLVRAPTLWDNLHPPLLLSLSPFHRHTFTHILNECDRESTGPIPPVTTHVHSCLLFLSMNETFFSPPPPPSLSLSSRCGWVGESCPSQTALLPCSAKRPESSGRARAKGCSRRETASLHKPGRHNRFFPHQQ